MPGSEHALCFPPLMPLCGQQLAAANTCAAWTHAAEACFWMITDDYELFLKMFSSLGQALDLLTCDYSCQAVLILLAILFFDIVCFLIS